MSEVLRGDISGYAELHCASVFSFLRAGSSVEALVARAHALGMPALALTDQMTLAGAVRFQAACAEIGLGGVLGAELAVADNLFGAGETARVVALAENATGYARLCQLLTDANLSHPDAPAIPFDELAAEPEGLIVLTGGRAGPLARALLAGRRAVAEELARRYLAAFGPERLFIEVQSHLLPDSVGLAQALAEIAASAGARRALTNGARYAAVEDYALYDLLTCIRLGITVDQPHRERPRNDTEALVSGAELAGRLAMFPWTDAALATSAEIAARCVAGGVGLLRPSCVAPRAPRTPEGVTPRARLAALCERGLSERYAQEPAARAAESVQRRQLAHELEVISELELEEFFLCVHDIVSAGRRLGIRLSGRGSAANSLVAYLLGVTGVDPIAHRLLFARFLTPERRGMPDIDIDVQSDRREELIRYVERTYTERHAAMVANVITYRPRSALRDVAKALGYPLPLVDRMTRILHHHGGGEALLAAQDELARLIADFQAPHDRAPAIHGPVPRTTLRARLPLALALAARLLGLPRHLSLHNGGMVLTREPLAQTLPVRLSANGVRALEVDKDDVERLGLIKFDLLGLRTLGAVEEALALIEETTGARVPIDHLPLDDEATFELIRAGQTLAVFQIESPGQWHLLAQTQPRTLDDLIVQTALFRPGPLQANMVHPYVQRRQAQQPQRDAVQTPWKGGPPDDFWTAHPILGPILRESEGILLFQEQILEIAHTFAGLSYADADGFRRAMSHARTPAEMEAMRARFIGGAVQRGEQEAGATRVFDAISQFVGYGFCKSHAAEFARTIYQTAWLKAHYPAHYLAAFLSAQPAGFFPPHVVLEEAKRLGVPILPVEINRSEDRFSVERVGGRGRERWAIRIGLRQVAQVGEELARAILWERRGAPGEQGDARQERPFTSLEDALGRLRPLGLTLAAAESLALCGALDGLAPRMERRQRLWRLREVWPLVAGAAPAKRGRAGSGARALAPDAPRQLTLSWAAALATPDAAAPEGAQLPQVALPALDAKARDALDYALLGMSARPHPVRALRRDLRRRGVRTIAELAEAPAGQVTRVAGWVISAQRPPTARGMGFLVLEDETGRLPVALPPRLAAQMHALIRHARVVIVTGSVERVRWYRSLLALDLQAHDSSGQRARSG